LKNSGGWHDDDYERPVESAVARSAAMWCCMTSAIREAFDFASSAQEKYIFMLRA
jgi:hypothetical protein